ncbi:MAG: CBS domain-containing protein [Methanobrevibacter sp.]|jgi:predicted transcriptional regulator|nr:CBS domain-containing protein [Candidatus Methanoflexus mossambicus]
MLTAIQNELLKTLINLYRVSNGASVKGEDIADVMRRSPGTIRNQMLILRNLGLVKGVPGPRGGYKPTIEAYHKLDIKVSDEEAIVPVFKDDSKLDNISVAKIEFTSIPNPGDCEAVIKVLGNIKDLDIGENIRIGPTPVNHLMLTGKIIGRDDMDNILLLDSTSIGSVPKLKIKEVGSSNFLVVKESYSIKKVAEILINNAADGAPVFNNDDKVVGMVTLNDIVRAVANSILEHNVSAIMSKNVFMINENEMISKIIGKMQKYHIGRVLYVDDNKKLKGIITKTDILNVIGSYVDSKI